MDFIRLNKFPLLKTIYKKGTMKKNKFILVSVIFQLLFTLTACKDNGHNKKISNSLIPEMNYFSGDSFCADGIDSSLKNKQKTTDWKKVDLYKPVINIQKEGYVCYIVKIPEIVFSDPVLFIPAGSYWGSFEVYLDKKLLYQSVNPITLRKSPLFYHPHIIPLPPGCSGKNLSFRFFTHYQGPFGILDKIYVDSKYSVLERIIQDQFDRLILGVIFIFVGLISLFVFLIKFNNRLYPALSLFLMSLSFGFYVVFSSDISIIFFTTAQFANNITFISIILFPVGLFGFIDQTISPGWKNFIRKSWQFFLIISFPAIVLSLMNLQMDIPISLFILIRSLILSVTVFIALVHVIFYIFKGFWAARIISIGLLIFSLSVLSDVLFRLKKVDSLILHYHWGFFILLLSLGYVLFRIFDNSQKKLKIYSEELQEKSEILQDLNRTLEEKVQERTEELNQTNVKIMMQNEILAQRNRIIEKEIIMARSIQQQLIPDKSPFENISSLYRPMNLVGGDFYDFIVFEDSKNIGIFISDVSGHGIAAAFITSMIKTIILQAGDLLRDPAQLFTYLNEILFGKTAENFITAFYCIINPVDNTVVYSNAGHNLPYIIGDGKLEQLGGKKNVPIAMLTNSEMIDRNKIYENNHVKLEGINKILLYTDGLTEAVNIDTEGDFFEETVMPDVLRQNHMSKSSELIDILYTRLVEYRGSDSFDDDVCIISIDL